MYSKGRMISHPRDDFVPTPSGIFFWVRLYYASPLRLATMLVHHHHRAMTAGSWNASFYTAGAVAAQGLAYFTHRSHCIVSYELRNLLILRTDSASRLKQANREKHTQTFISRLRRNNDALNGIRCTLGLGRGGITLRLSPAQSIVWWFRWITWKRRSSSNSKLLLLELYVTEATQNLPTLVFQFPMKLFQILLERIRGNSLMRGAIEAK